MTTQTIINTLVQSVQMLGWIRFGIIIVINIVLWKIHGLLGLIGTILTIAYLLHYI